MRIELQRLHQVDFGELRGSLAIHHRELRARDTGLLLVEIGYRARTGIDVGLDLLLECRLRRQVLTLHLQLFLLRDQDEVVGRNGESDRLPRALQVEGAGVAIEFGSLERRGIAEAIEQHHAR